MTTAPPVRPEAITLPPVGTGERQRRRRARRRLGRQQMLVVMLMVLALFITIAVLAQQWLATGVNSSGNQTLHRAGTGTVVVAVVPVGLTKEM